MSSKGFSAIFEVLFIAYMCVPFTDKQYSLDHSLVYLVGQCEVEDVASN